MTNNKNINTGSTIHLLALYSYMLGKFQKEVSRTSEHTLKDMLLLQKEQRQDIHYLKFRPSKHIDENLKETTTRYLHQKRNNHKEYYSNLKTWYVQMACPFHFLVPEA